MKLLLFVCLCLNFLPRSVVSTGAITLSSGLTHIGGPLPQRPTGLTHRKLPQKNTFNRGSLRQRPVVVRSVSRGDSEMNPIDPEDYVGKGLEWSGSGLNDPMNFGKGLLGRAFSELFDQLNAEDVSELLDQLNPKDVGKGVEWSISGLNNQMNPEDVGKEVGRAVSEIYNQMNSKDVGKAAKTVQNPSTNDLKKLGPRLRHNSNDPNELAKLLDRFKTSKDIKVLANLINQMYAEDDQINPKTKSAAIEIAQGILDLTDKKANPASIAMAASNLMQGISHLMDEMNPKHAMRIESKIAFIAWTSMGGKDLQAFENGITRDEQGRIIGIDWIHQGLDGSLHLFFAALSQLRHL